MAEYIKVSSQRIGQDKESILEELKGIEHAVESLYTGMQALGQTWEGPAWNAFQGQVASDIENMQAINGKLSEYLTHMEYAQNEYVQCENKVEQLVSSIKI